MLVTPAQQSADEENQLLLQLIQLHSEDAEAARNSLQRNPQFYDPQMVGQLYKEVVKLAPVDLDKAELLAHTASWLADELDDHLWVVDCW